MKNLLKLFLLLFVLNATAQRTDKSIQALYGATFENATEVTTATKIPVFDTNLKLNTWINPSVITNGFVQGTGTTNYVAKFTAAGTVGNSQIFDNGTNVGIGTTTPSAKLEVDGNLIVGNYLLADEAGIISDNDQDNAGLVIKNNGSGDARLRMSVTAGGYTLGVDNSDSDKFKISSGNGLGTGDIFTIYQTNVGIGTSSPGFKLDVSSGSGNGARISTTGFTNLDLVSNRTSGNLGAIRWKQDIDSFQTSEFLGLHGGGFDWKTGDGSVSPDIKMTIDTYGRVGIGTTNPSEKLEVIGNIEASNGFILTDTQNTNRYKITIVNGVLTTTLIP